MLRRDKMRWILIIIDALDVIIYQAIISEIVLLLKIRHQKALRLRTQNQEEQ